jgi:hypothetical protein
MSFAVAISPKLARKTPPQIDAPGRLPRCVTPAVTTAIAR